MERMKRYPWPGNVRELENLDPAARGALSAGRDRRVADRGRAQRRRRAVERARSGVGRGDARSGDSTARRASGEGFNAAMERAVGDLFRSFGGASPQAGLYHRVLHDLEAPLIAATLALTRGNQIKAAEILGLNRNTLRKKIRDLNLREMPTFR